MGDSRAAEIARLDEVIAAAWRAPVREELDGWELRYGYGLTGRANSAWPRRTCGGLTLEDRIDRLEAWYRERGLPPKVQLSPASEPGGLDEELERRGWERSSDVLIETADASAVEPDRDVDLVDRPDAAWLDVWLGQRFFPRDQADRVLPMLGGGDGDTVFARLNDQQQWQHAFGISPLSVLWQNVKISGGYRAVHHGDPSISDGGEGALVNVYAAYIGNLFLGIHMAGPILTPDSFAQGMFRYPKTGGTAAFPLTYYTEVARGVMLRGEDAAFVHARTLPVAAIAASALLAAVLVFRRRLP